MLQILFLFMAYAIIGWLWETPYVSIKERKFINRGFLHGPYVSIYGFSCVAVIISMSMLEGFANATSVWAIFLQMLYIACITAVFEYITSYALEKVFKSRWWDYGYRKYNLNGRVALSSTIFFGIGGYALWHFVNPVLVNLYNSIDESLVIGMVILFYAVYILDNIITLVQLNKFKKLTKALSKIQDKLSKKYKELLDKTKKYKKFFKKYPGLSSKKFKEQFADIKKNFSNRKQK